MEAGESPSAAAAAAAAPAPPSGGDRDRLPLGVLAENRGWYSANLVTESGDVYLGLFDTVAAASAAVRRASEGRGAPDILAKLAGGKGWRKKKQEEKEEKAEENEEEKMED